MKLVLSLLIFFSATASALAQETTRVEVFGGYSFSRDSDANYHGWNTSVNYNFNNFFGVKADLSGHYNSTTFFDPINLVSAKVDSSDFTYLFGPQFSYRKNRKLVPFTHVLLGGVRTKFSGVPFNAGPISGTISASNTSFGAAFGGGLDLKLKKGLAFRLVQADYLVSHAYDAPRLSTGLVFRF